MITKNVNTHAHGDVHLVVLAYLRRRWSLSSRDMVSDFSEVFFTVFMHWTLASGAHARPVNSGRSACEGTERANAGHGTSACPVHFCGPPDAMHQHPFEVMSAQRGGEQSCGVLTGRWAHPISTHRTCLVKDFTRWTLTRNDQTPR
jgi:hypothetical protein